MTADRAALPPAEWLDGPSPPDVPREAAAVYSEIAAHLRVPFLGSFWRSLAWEPAVFSSLWEQLRPLLSSRAFEREAAGLRHAALIEEVVEMSSHQAFKGDLVRSEIDFEMRERIANYNAAVHYALPKTLLVATWLLTPGTGSPPADDSSPVPVGIAPGAVAVPPAPPNEVRGRLAELLEEIPRAHGHALADDYFRSIGRLVDYLNAAWNAIKPVVRDEPYDERARLLVDGARAAAARLGGGGDAARSLNVGEQDRSRLDRVLRYYAERHLPDMLLDVAMIKGLTDGPERAQDSPYELT